MNATFYCGGCAADISEPLPADTKYPASADDFAALAIQYKTAHEIREHADDLLDAS
jgi:hypothetical protein